METKDTEDNVTWITVNGAHVPIPEGMTAGAAIQKHFGKEDRKESKKSDKEWKKDTLAAIDKLNGTTEKKEKEAAESAKLKKENAEKKAQEDKDREERIKSVKMIDPLTGKEPVSIYEQMKAKGLVK